MAMKKICLVATGLLLIVHCNLSGQTVKIPLTLASWDTIDAKPVPETYMGKESFLLTSGTIIAKGVELRDGTIEADFNFSRERGFPGIQVRMQDNFHYENFYM